MTNKAKITTPNLIAERLCKLKELMPDLFNLEGKINPEALFNLADSYSASKKEKYEFNWAGKLECQKLALEPTNSCLLPNKAKSVNFDKTQNIIIEGDNLEVLKTLYQPYFEKIKCIYIDPPYNTGNDFIYDDKKSEGEKAYWQRSGVNQDGVKLQTNPESTGRKHSLWCSFIYPRLMLARNLLKQDGVIFVSIDDNEVHNLRKMMDEVFGEENFVANFAIKTPNQTEDSFRLKNLDYLLCYAKNIDSTKFLFEKKLQSARCTTGNELQTQPEIDFPAGLEVNGVSDGIYENPRKTNGNEDIEIVKGRIIVKNSKLAEPVTLKARWSNPNDIRAICEKIRNNSNQKIFNKFGKELIKLWLKGDRFQPQIDKIGFDLPESIWTEFSKKGGDILRNLVKKAKFDYPKHPDLIKNILKITTKFDDQILDFFAGSGTTAHAVIKLNAEEKIKYAKENHPKLEKGEIVKQDYLQGLSEAGSRKFILTQLPEYTDEKSEAFKVGYKTIFEICLQRVKRAGEKIIEGIKLEKNLSEKAKEQIISSLDFGFKTYQLKDTNIAQAHYQFDDDNILQEYLTESKQLELLSKDQTNLLYEIAIKNGFDLTVDFKKIESIKENEVYQIIASNRESALICVDREIKIGTVPKIEAQALMEKRDWQFFCFDNALNINVKANLKNKVKVIVI